MTHIREAVVKMAVPESKDYLTAPPEELDRSRKGLLCSAKRSQHSVRDDWIIGDEEVETLIKYLGQADRKGTASGPDGFTPDLILRGGQAARQGLRMILQLAAAARGVPKAWKRMRLLLAHKPGRPTNRIGKGYRPIVIGSLLTKGIEKVVKVEYEKCLSQPGQRLHPACHAYRKGIGREMAIYVLQSAVLAYRAECKVAKVKPERLFAFLGDVSHAFCGADLPMLEVQEYYEHGLRGSRWLLGCDLSADLSYTVEHCGHETEVIEQKFGLGQGPSLSPTKFNVSISPVLYELEEAGAGVTVGGRNITEVGWSDDLAIIIKDPHATRVLKALELASGKFRKILHNEKVHAVHLHTHFNPAGVPMQDGKLGLRLTDTTPLLGNKPIDLQEAEILLGYFIGGKLQGDKRQQVRAYGRAKVAAAKTDAMHLYSGNKVASKAGEFYHNGLVESTLVANLTCTQLVGNSVSWTDEVTSLQAQTIRRTYAASMWCPSYGLLIECGWRPTLATILEAKLALYDRIGALPSHEDAKHVQTVRLGQISR